MPKKTEKEKIANLRHKLMVAENKLDDNKNCINDLVTRLSIVTKDRDILRAQLAIVRELIAAIREGKERA